MPKILPCLLALSINSQLLIVASAHLWGRRPCVFLLCSLMTLNRPGSCLSQIFCLVFLCLACSLQGCGFLSSRSQLKYHLLCGAEEGRRGERGRDSFPSCDHCQRFRPLPTPSHPLLPDPPSHSPLAPDLHHLARSLCSRIHSSRSELFVSPLDCKLQRAGLSVCLVLCVTFT